MDEGQVSMTARRVVAYRRSFERVVTDYGRPDADLLLADDVAAGIEVEPTPMARYLRVRTAFIDGVVTRAIEAGTTQIVAVGAGYDGRCLRYAKPGVAWFELDHPDTQRDKRARLDRLGIDTAGVGFAAVDFVAGDVGAALERAGHDAALPTLFTCEGVAGYLDTDVTAALLRTLARRAAPSSRLAITLSIVPDTPAGELARERLDAAVSGVGEPLRSALARNAIDPFLADAGWLVSRCVDPAGSPLAESTRTSAFVVAEVDRHR